MEFKKNQQMKSKNTRREFLELSGKLSIAIPFLGTALLACDTKNKPAKESKETSTKKLNILILGGTSFLGPHQIAYALERGHKISTFTRGKSIPSVHQDVFEKVEQLIGDREDNLTALENRKWDVVIDNSGRNVEWTKKTAELLKDNVGLYVYTSSTGVYYPYLRNDISEKTEVLLEVPEKLEEEYMRMEYDYGVMKANSENEAKKAFGEDRTIVVRPTYMIGPGDKTDRFIHWPVRLSKGGKTLVPGKKDDPVQYIDVRDVAEWMIRLIEDKNTNTFNGVGPKNSQNIHQFVDEAKTAFDVNTTAIAIDNYDFLKKNNIYYIVPWIIAEGNNVSSALISNKLALENGLTIRPLKESMTDIYNWWYSDAIPQERRDNVENDPKSILSREKSILEDWATLQSKKE